MEQEGGKKIKKKIHSLQVPVRVVEKYQLLPLNALCVQCWTPPATRLSPFPRLGAGSAGLCHRQREGPCQVSGSLAVAAVGSVLFSCFALACRLGLLLSSALVKAAGSFETFASRQQAAAHSS